MERLERLEQWEHMLAFYRGHSPITNPGPCIGYMQALPNNIAQLVDILGGICAHFERDLDDMQLQLPAERLPEVDLRFVGKILARILELDPRPLDQARPLLQRHMGTCRDISVVYCSMLRTLGIPARARYGFTPFRMKRDKPWMDHVLVEYWSSADQQWKYCDPRLSRELRERHNIYSVDPIDIPAENFVSGAQAWLMCQESEQAALRLSGLKFDAAFGMWKARNLFLYDLTSLSGNEPLMWDAWGYILANKPWVRPRGSAQFRQLNQLAQLDPCDPEQWLELLNQYHECRNIRASKTIKACSHINGDHYVTIGRKEAVFHAVS